jgi:hypothetical protein
VPGVLGSAIARHHALTQSEWSVWWAVGHVVALRFRRVAKCNLCGKWKAQTQTVTLPLHVAEMT